MKPVRVLLAIEQDDFREILRRALSAKNTGIVLVGEAANDLEAIELASQASPDVLILDLHLKDQGGLELTQKIKARFPATRILILNTQVKKEEILDLVDSGIAGYLTILEAPELLASAIHSCMKEVLWLSPDVQARLLETP
ncbi:MAG TPA: response regulator transcription factor [Anaerolineales bacterium]|nr:response regulator transcription factor [Anaerolineales bacterium]